MKLECISLSINDILYIMSLINKDINKFKSLSKNDSFMKTVREIRRDEYKLDKQLETEKTKRRFFGIFNDEKNANFRNIYLQNDKNKEIKFYQRMKKYVLK